MNCTCGTYSTAASMHDDDDEDNDNNYNHYHDCGD